MHENPYSQSNVATARDRHPAFTSPGKPPDAVSA